MEEGGAGAGGLTATAGARPPARIRGEPYTDLPQDLYIPPDALEVFLDAFEGPLDLLLYLIRRHNLDILDIPIAEVTHQYMEYIALVQELRLELAADYLVMAATLAEIKSRLLLPRPAAAQEAEADPRAELVRRLQAYERYRQAALDLDALPRLERDMLAAGVMVPSHAVPRVEPRVGLGELLEGLAAVMRRAELHGHHHVRREPLSVRERMGRLLEVLEGTGFAAFPTLFTLEEGRRGVVVTFLAILELMRESLLELVQAEPFGPIYVRLHGGEAARP